MAHWLGIDWHGPLIVSTNGYMFCLDPLTGQILWNNPLKGYGTGPASLVSVRGGLSSSLPEQAAQADAEKQAADASATTTHSAGQ